MTSTQFSGITQEILRDIHICEKRLSYLEKEMVKIKVYLSIFIVIVNLILNPLISYLIGCLK